MKNTHFLETIVIAIVSDSISINIIRQIFERNLRKYEKSSPSTRSTLVSHRDVETQQTHTSLYCAVCIYRHAVHVCIHRQIYAQTSVHMHLSALCIPLGINNTCFSSGLSENCLQYGTEVKIKGDKEQQEQKVIIMKCFFVKWQIETESFHFIIFFARK